MAPPDEASEIASIEIVILAEDEEASKANNSFVVLFIDEDERFREKASSRGATSPSGSLPPVHRDVSSAVPRRRHCSSTEEIDFAFSVWRHFRKGSWVSPQGHTLGRQWKRWAYTSKRSNEYSMVLTGWPLPPVLQRVVTEAGPETRHLVTR